jgi:YVTN family beta-propeller protein
MRFIVAVFRLATWGSGVFLLLPGMSEARSAAAAYVANSESDTVSVIDTATNAVTATVPVGAGLRPRGIALAPDDRRLYVTNPSTDSVSVVDLHTHAIATLDLPDCPALQCNPEAVVASRDGRFVYVLNHPFDAVWVQIIDAVAWQVVGRTAANTCDTVGGIATIAITPDGSTVYATGPCGLSIIDTTSRTEVRQIPGDYFDVAVTPDGAQAVLAGFRQVAVLDTATNRIGATLVVNPLPSQQSPSLVAISRDGRVAYVVAGTELLLIDVATATVQDTIDLGEGNYPWQVAVLPDGARIGLATPDHLLVFDTITSTLTGSFALTHVPEAMTVSADGQLAYLTNRSDRYDGGAAGTVSIVELATGTVHDLFPEAVPIAVAAAPDGTIVYVANFGSDEIAVIDPSVPAVRGAIPIYQPSAVVIDSARKVAYVSARSSADPYASGVIGVIDVTASRLVSAIAVEGPPGALVLTPNGQHLYAAVPRGIAVIDTATRTSRTAALDTSPSLVDLAVSADGTLLYHASATFLPHRESLGAIRVVDINHNQILATIGTGGFHGIVVAPNGTVAYATGREGVAVIDTTTNTIVRTILASGRQLAITRDGRFLYLLSTAVSVVDTTTNAVVATVPVGNSPAAIALVDPRTSVSNAGHGDGCSVDPEGHAHPAVPLILFLLPWLLHRVSRSRI